MRPRRESLLLQSINCRWTTFLIIALHVIQPDIFRESDDIINSYSKKTENESIQAFRLKLVASLA